MKTRIFFDCTRLIHRAKKLTPTGIDRVDIHYLYSLIKNTNEVNVSGVFQTNKYFLQVPENLLKEIATLVHNKWIENSIADETYSNQVTSTVKKILESLKGSKILRNNFIDERLTSNYGRQWRNAAYLNTTFSGIENQELHAKFKMKTGAKMIYFIHDILPIEYPEYFWPEWDIAHLNKLKSIASNADQIITVSFDVKNKVEQLFSTLNLNPCRVTAIQNGVEELFINSSIKNPENYSPVNQFTIVSTIEPRKNHQLLLNIWREFASQEITGTTPTLVIIGSRGWHNQNTFDFIDKSTITKPYIRELNDVSDKIMIEEIKKSRAVLFPSFGEGWGLPIVEAMTLGVPTICSDISVHRESTKNKAIYINPLDTIRWKEKILELNDMSIEDIRKKQKETRDFKPQLWSESNEQLLFTIKNLQSQIH